MKIGLAAAKVVDKDISANFEQMKYYMGKAKEAGAELVCFGESFLQGFNALTWNFEEDKHMAVSQHGSVMGNICELSQKIGIDVMFGYMERDEMFLYSSCALVAEGRVYHNYRRISRGWKEYRKTDDHYREGVAPESFVYRGRKCAIGLCGDLWEFPDKFRLDEDVLFWPVYVSWTEEEWCGGGREEYAEQAALCCANTLYINSVCDEDAFGGAIWFAEGKIKEELPIGGEGVLVIEI